MKIRSDMLFLSMIDAQQKILVFTEQDMLDRITQEKQNGRVPLDIELLHAPLPKDLAEALATSRKRASKEVSPRQKV